MKKVIYGVLAFAPIVASAQSLTNIVNIVTSLKSILALLIPMAFGLAILYFFYGIAKYILAAGDAEKANEGKSIMIYGVIAIAVMSSIWGLVYWLQQTFGVTGTTAPQNITAPTVTL